MSLENQIPVFYKNIIDSQVLKLKVSETKATCDQCLRARDGRFEYLYKNNLKCCTFFPFLPNYAVGGIIAEGLEKSDVILRFIEEKRFALPLGIFPDLAYQFRFQNRKAKDFGRRDDLLCPYYDQQKNRCGIWKFRGVVCTTYFCRSDYGSKGQKFWAATKDYFSFVEMALAEDCLVMKDFSPRDISDQLQFLNRQEWTQRERGQTYLTATEFKKFWNGYSDPVDFYLHCYEAVQKLNRHDFKQILMDQGLTLEHNMIKQGKLCLS